MFGTIDFINISCFLAAIAKHRSAPFSSRVSQLFQGDIRLLCPTKYHLSSLSVVCSRASSIAVSAFNYPRKHRVA